MKLKRGPVAFHNLLKLTDTCVGENWATMAMLMRNFVIMNNLYTNAPVFYQVEIKDREKDLREYSIYAPINKQVQLDEDVPMTFIPELLLEDSLMFRVADSDTLLEEAYLLLDACAEAQNCVLMRPFYHVSFDVFGETMTDVIAAIDTEGVHVQSE